jgi:hypothetical protein
MREHLRESCSFPSNLYTIVPKDEYEKRGVHQKLTERTENYTSDTLMVEALKLRESLKESSDKVVLDKVITKLKEAGTGENSFKVWKLPIGRYDNVNGNKRIYPRKLWENVKNNQQSTWKGIAGLMDHPEKDDDPGLARDQSIVWHDMDVGDEGVVFGYGTFVGPFGHLAQEIIECGGRCGFSSSGFGDVDDYTKEVDPETYTIERLADIVINPSQDVYGTVDCPHTPQNFMKDVHQAATIEFEKQRTLQEGGVSKIIQNRRMKEMADQNQTKVDAVNPQAGAPAAQSSGGNQAQGTPPQQAPAQQSAQAPAQQQAPAPQQQAVKESLTRVEEKAFRKYVSAFIDEAKDIKNPILRLNECTEILSYFENGVCPDLKVKLEEHLIEEKIKLEKLIESTVKVEEDFGIDVVKLRENAEKITETGLILNEQVTDYKELCEELVNRNKKLIEDNKELYKRLRISEKLREKTDTVKSKTIVNVQSTAEKLSETVHTIKERNNKLMERLSEMNLTNKDFEKRVGITETKLREAVELLQRSKEAREELSAKLNESETKRKELLKKHEESIHLYESQAERLEKVTTECKRLQEEIENNDPRTHVMPKFEDRVGKFFNLRENKGAEIEMYWEDLVGQYGDSVKLFEHEIRDSKTLREATSAFLRNRAQIDPDFAVAQPVNQYAYRNRAERAKLLESQGVPVPSLENASHEALNDDFMARAAAAGLR